MKVGIIDLGTNTFNLLIAELDNMGNYKPVYRSRVGVKLGEGSFEKNYITEEAMQRAIVALQAQISMIKNQYCDRILAFATSAVRNASNGEAFVERVFEQFGVRIKVIDGEKEARMIYQGVQMSGALSSEKSVIMDIGGGSVEFIISNDEEIIWKQSYELGVTRMREKFNPSDPMTADERAEVEKFFLAQTSDLIEVLNKENVRTLVGSSGSFETFSDVIRHRDGSFEAHEEDKTIEFDTDLLKAHLSELINSTRSEREKMDGMAAMRIDLITLAALFVNLIFTHSGIRNARLSKYALKEGVLFDVLKGNI